MRRIDIFVSSPEDVQKERSLVERTIRAVAGEFNVPITVTYSNWLRQSNSLDKIAVPSVNGAEDGRTWLCPCFWEYRDFELDQEYREQIPNTGSFDLVISILWSRLGTRVSPAFVMPDGSQPKTANEYEIGWVLDQLNRTPGFPELRVYRNRSAPSAPVQPRTQREAFFREWDGVQEFFAFWENRKPFVEACSDYADLEEFESLFRVHFRDFLTRQLAKEIVPRRRLARSHSWKSEPFRGLRPFDFEHAPIFHGRTKASGDVLDALGQQANSKTPFVLVLGGSGSGKSSLVRAGVLPLLTEIGTAANEGPWRYALTRPGFGPDPFESLASALLAPTALPELKKTKMRDEWRKLAGELKEDPDKVALRITELIDRISAQELDQLLNRQEDQTPVPGRIESIELLRHRKLRRRKPKAQIALFIDQLEDLFTSSLSLELQHQYLAAIAGLVRSQRVYVIAALGSDYYATYQQFPELVALTNPSGRFDLQPPARAELGKMIRSPAEAAGLKFEREAKTGQGLDDSLIDSAIASPDHLPLLEHLLSRLYRKQQVRDDGVLRWSDYAELGELDGALAHHAEDVFTKLSGDARQAFDFVMRRLAPIDLDQRASGRRAFYRDLVSSPDLDQRLRGGAKSFVDSMVEEGLFASETDFRQQTVISVAHPALFRKWPRVREWLIEDQEVLRMRDRVEGCLKLWLMQGRETHDLLSPGLSLADGETLLNHFRSSLSKLQIDYIQKSLAEQKRSRRTGYLLLLPVLIALLSLGAILGVRWYNNESLRARALELGKLERKLVELSKGDLSGNQTQLKEAEEKTRLAQHDAEISAAQRSAVQAELAKAEARAKEHDSLALKERSTLQTQLKEAQDKLQQAQQNADIAAAQRAAFETQLKQTQQNADLISTLRASLELQLKQAQDKLQQAQQDADQASTQRTGLEAQLKQAQDKLQQAQQDADQASTQRTGLETQLKEAQDKLQQAQQNVNQASTQRTGLEAQLKQAQDKLRQAQQDVDQASTQRAGLEVQLKQAQDKLEAVRQDVELAAIQRADLEAELKQAKDKSQQSPEPPPNERGTLEAQLKQTQVQLQQAQQNADLATTQRAGFETQLKQAQDKLQQALQNAEAVATQRASIESQLKQAQDKLQQAQQNADAASAQRSGLETQLKQAQDKLQQSQQNADLAATQRSGLESQLKQAQDKLQQSQQNADLAATQRSGLESQLKQAQDKLQQAQQNADAASAQRSGLESQLKQAQDKLQQAQKNTDAASAQRAGLETQLKQAQDKLQQAQQNADLASTQRAAFETQLKQAQDKLQQAQQNSNLALSQRAAFESQLKQAQDKLQQAQQTADRTSNQRAGTEAQLKQAQDKLQQVQQSADLASTQRVALETQLKQAQDKLQQAQQNADLASNQRASLEGRLKKAEENLQLVQQQADAATAQRTELEAQLKEAQEKAVLAQKIADLVAAQARPEENGTPKSEAAAKNGNSANSPRSGRALPLDTGRNPDPGTSTQPLTHPVPSPHH
jgi:hypothetical protein